MNNVYIPSGVPSGLSKNSDKSKIGANVIFKIVEEYFGIERTDLLNKSKKIYILYPRQLCQWLLWKYSAHNPTGIGIMFGQKDYSACLNSINAIEAYLDTDEKVVAQIEELEAKLIEIKNSMD